MRRVCRNNVFVQIWNTCEIVSSCVLWRKFFKDVWYIESAFLDFIYLLVLWIFRRWTQRSNQHGTRSRYAYFQVCSGWWWRHRENYFRQTASNWRVWEEIRCNIRCRSSSPCISHQQRANTVQCVGHCRAGEIWWTARWLLYTG